MPSYETLDKIADSYVPLLALVILATLVLRLKQPRQVLAEFCKVFLLAAIAYGLMFVDKTLIIWAQKGLDYSTHTATAAACCWYLFWLKQDGKLLTGVFRKAWVFTLWPLSLIAYLLLMRYQGYHTWPDMISTLFALLPLFVIHRFATR